MLLRLSGVGAFGMFLERTVIRRFYKDKLGALVATWGISLILSQGMLLFLGPSLIAVPLPEWTLSYAGYSFGGYRLLLFAASILVVLLAWWVFYHTPFGLRSRAAMHKAAIGPAP